MTIDAYIFRNYDTSNTANTALISVDEEVCIPAISDQHDLYEFNEFIDSFTHRDDAYIDVSGFILKRQFFELVNNYRSHEDYLPFQLVKPYFAEIVPSDSLTITTKKITAPTITTKKITAPTITTKKITAPNIDVAQNSQVAKNAAAISLLQSWLNIDNEDDIAEQKKSLDLTKSSLNENRLSSRKLYL